MANCVEILVNEYKRMNFTDAEEVLLGCLFALTDAEARNELDEHTEKILDGLSRWYDCWCDYGMETDEALKLIGW